MPNTAAERGLLDPFDPMEALPKAAQFLRELKDQFGNLGLAAAAYNAGPARVRAWLAGTRELPGETRNYVAAVTGFPADEWAEGGARKPAVKTSPNCSELMARIEAPSDPLHGDHQEAPYSHSGMVKQPASSQEPPPSSHGTSAQPDDAQLAQGGRIEAQSDPLRGDFVTPHQEGSYSRSDDNLFLEKLTERVKLTADSPWGIQPTAGFSRERVLRAYADLASQYAGILAGRNASILAAVPGSSTKFVSAPIRLKARIISVRTSGAPGVPAWCCATARETMQEWYDAPQGQRYDRAARCKASASHVLSTCAKRLLDCWAWVIRPSHDGLSSGPANRQMLNRLEAWHAAPLDLGLVHFLLTSRQTAPGPLSRAAVRAARAERSANHSPRVGKRVLRRHKAATQTNISDRE
jgi:hypothetical protein